ncbi:ABC transporter permease [Amycolatopsis jejuensis]|uniref:ABC transporter permease n=1 Tax=Amycolatopsis jejuensis TaxID=330084 RepID=UPI0005271D30|nr:ABC transporter permease [Amycolatopsis jejuensis]
MLTYVLRRFGYSVPVVLVASFLLFWGVRTAFDPLAKLRFVPDPTVLARETARLGLDRPVPVQYWLWLKEFVTGDWGTSSRTGGPVRDLIFPALGTTLQLLFWGALFASLVALAVGVYSAVRQYSVGDFALTGLSYVGIAMPPFWLGLILIQVLAAWPQQQFGTADPPLYFVGLHSASGGGFGDYVRHLVLPVLTLTVGLVASWSRYTRATMLETLASDYVRTARAKGVPRWQVITRHALRTALGPFVSIAAVDAGILFGGLVVTEQIFAIRGMGRLFLDSLVSGDVFVLIPWMLVVAAAVIVFNLLADVSYALLDPRVRLR